MFPDLHPFSYVEVTVSTDVVSLSVPAETCFAVLRFEDGPVRYRVDGGAPSTTVGLPGEHGDQLPLWYQSVAQFRVIRSGGADGVVRATFYRKR